MFSSIYHFLKSLLWNFLLQAEKDLQPWIARDDEQGQKKWRINQRIIKLIVELMRNHDSPEALMILAGASDILLRATDGMLVDGEACTLPQLEVTSETQLEFYRALPVWMNFLTFWLFSQCGICHYESSFLFWYSVSRLYKHEQLLEVTARAVRLVIQWGESGLAVADDLSNLLKVTLLLTRSQQQYATKCSILSAKNTVMQCRLPAAVQCLSHPSAHVRALSIAVLRNIIQNSTSNGSGRIHGDAPGLSDPSYQCLNLGIINWHSDVEKCLKWEARSRLATGLTLAFLSAAAKELGCPISCWAYLWRWRHLLMYM